MKNNISGFFDDFSEKYDDFAFNQSLGTRYLSKIEEDFILKNLMKKGQKVLHIGIGTGRLASLLVERSAIVEGIDISKKMIEKAKNKLKDKPVNFTVAEAGKIPFENNIFDYVICVRVLKYIPTWKKTLKEVSRVIKKGGFFILEIDNLYSVKYFGSKNANYFLFKFKEVERTLNRDGFKIIKVKAGSRLPFPLYKKIDNKIVLDFIRIIESVLDNILPKSILSRNMLLLCTKIMQVT